MKMYYFNPNNYNQTYTVMSDSKAKAFDTVKNHIVNNEEQQFNRYEWLEATVDNLPDGYTIDEFDVDVVLEGEIS